LELSVNIFRASPENLKQPLQSKYLRLVARGARLESAESVKASQPDNDNH
jgi:hypothetical protein